MLCQASPLFQTKRKHKTEAGLSCVPTCFTRHPFSTVPFPAVTVIMRKLPRVGSADEKNATAYGEPLGVSVTHRRACICSAPDTVPRIPELATTLPGGSHGAAAHPGLIPKGCKKLHFVV
jgi:hypothetical protein